MKTHRTRLCTVLQISRAVIAPVSGKTTGASAVRLIRWMGLGLLLANSLVLSAERDSPPEPPAEVASDPLRLAQFELAQLRKSLAKSAQEQKRDLTAAHLRLQAAVAFDRAGMPVEANRELAIGSKLAGHLQVTLPPMATSNIPGEYDVSRDQRRICRAHANGRLEVWDVASGAMLSGFYAQEEQRPGNFLVKHVEFTPDGRRAVVGKPKQLELWDLDAKKLLRTIAPKEFFITGHTLGPDGATLVYWQPGMFSVLSLDKPEDVKHFDFADHNDQAHVRFTPTGDRFLAARYSHQKQHAQVLVIDSKTREPLFRREFEQTPAPSPGGAPWLDIERVDWVPSKTTPWEEILLPTFRANELELAPLHIRTGEGLLPISVGHLQATHRRPISAWDRSTPELCVVTWNRQQPARVWELRTAKKLFELPGSEDADDLFVLERAERGPRFLATRPFDPARLWSEVGGTVRGLGWREPLSGIAEDEAHKQVALFSRQTALVFGPNFFQEKTVCEMPGVTEARFLHDGRTLLTAVRESVHRGNVAISLWNLSLTERSLAIHRLSHGTHVAGIGFTPDEQRLIAWGDKVVNVWNIESRELLRTMNSPRLIVGGQMLGDRAATWDDSGELSIWNLTDGSRSTFETGAPRRRMVVSDDGSSLLTWDDDFFVNWFDLTQPPMKPPKATVIFEHPRELFGGMIDVQKSADGASVSRRSLTWSIDGSIILWDLSANKELGRWKSPKSVEQAVVLHEPLRVLSRSTNGSLTVWQPGQAEPIEHRESTDPKSLELESLFLKRLGQHRAERPSTFLRRSGNGAELVDASGKTLGKLIHSMTVYGDTTGPAGHQLLRDGQRLLTWSGNGTAMLWSLSGVRLQAFDHHELVFGQPAGNASRRFVGNPNRFQVRLLNQDRQLVTSDGSGTIALWPVSPPLPTDPSAALLELETRSKLKVDRFGNVVWQSHQEPPSK